LIPYLIAGFPSRDASLEALHMLVEEKADFVEIGIPFSDPLADGPVIQRASHAALEGGMSVAGVLELIRDSAPDGTPLIAFSYLNPVLAYGLEAFLADAHAAGFSGLLLTDLPAGTDPDIETAVQQSPLALVRLVALTTERRRLKAIVQEAQGFLYAIARLGVTGARTQVSDALESMVTALRAESHLPVAVGFGITNGEDARRVAGFADGVVVGSSLVDSLGQDIERARHLMRELRGALDTAPVA
jgi:tryptophan synthase alpha chain